MNDVYQNHTFRILTELLTAWFLGILWAFGSWGVVSIVFVTVGLGAMGSGSNAFSLNWLLLGLLLVCILFSPIIFLFLKTKNWLRSLLAGLLANLAGIVAAIIASMLLSGSNLGLDEPASTIVYATISSMVILLVVMSGIKRDGRRSFWGIAGGIGVGGLLAGVIIYFAEVFFLEKYFMSVLLMATPLTWLYSFLFIEFNSIRLDRISLLLSLALIFFLSGISLWMPYFCNELLAHYLLTF